MLCSLHCSGQVGDNTAISARAKAWQCIGLWVPSYGRTGFSAHSCTWHLGLSRMGCLAVLPSPGLVGFQSGCLCSPPLSPLHLPSALLGPLLALSGGLITSFSLINTLHNYYISYSVIVVCTFFQQTAPNVWIPCPSPVPFPNFSQVGLPGCSTSVGIVSTTADLKAQ